MFAQLGEHKFEGFKAPVSLSETHAERYAKIALVNGKDVIQHTGSELIEFSISVRYSTDFCDPVTEIAALKKSMADGEKLPFVSGEGEIYGNFVITGIDVNNERYSPTGVVEAASVNVKLLECETTEPAPKGTAVASAKPTVQTPAPAVVSPSNSIASDIAKGKSKVAAIKSTVTDVKKGITSYKRGVRDVRQLATDAQQSYQTAKNKVEATKKIAQRATQLPTSLDECISYAENLASITNVMDMSVLEMNVGKLSESSEKATGYAAPVAAFSATREGGN